MKFKFQYIIFILIGLFLLTSCEAEEYLCEALGHEYVETLVAPTCEEEGYTLHKCAYCEDSYKTNIIKPLGHKTENVDEVLPTCDKEGHTSGVKCTRCDYTTSKVIPVLGHDLTVFEAVDPTCLEIGLTEGCKCSRCSYEIKQETIPALGHDFKDWIIIEEPSEESTGLKVRKCLNCEHKEEEIIPVLPHTHKYETTLVNPTCNNKGFTLYTCKCEDTYKDNYVDALGHDLIVDEKVEPTCTSTGLTEGAHCSRCDYKEEQEIIPALGHDYKDVVINPTCTEEGYTTHTCDRCSDSYVDSYVDALGHSYGEWEIILDATEETEGLKKKTCSLCGDVVEQVIPKLEHTHKYETTALEPTCTKEGYTLYTCKCGDTYKDNYVDALGHDLIVDEKVEPTCTSTGLTEGAHCSRCDYHEEQTIIPELGHDYKDVVTTPTCTDKGYTTHNCERCSDSYVDSYVDALGHSYGQWEIVVEATEETEGLKKKTCSLCGDVVEQVIPKLAHTHKYDTTILEPTCTKDGYTLYTCKCGDTYKDNYVDALGHKLIIDEKVESTCTSTGLTEGAHCSRCDYHEEQTIIPALGHDYKDVVTAPTCTDKGYTTHNCEKCSDSYVDSYVDALGHSYGQWEILVEATEESEGLKKKTCSLCGDVVEQVIPKLEHTHKYEATTLEPTCTKDGYTLYTCKCGDSYKDNYIDALGHDLIVDEKVEPTCTLTGLTEGAHCSRCDYHEEQTIIPALGHDYKDVVTTPTCTDKGYTTHNCERCSDSYVDSYVDALGHDMIIDEKVEPTCTTTGLTEGSHCSRCNYEIAQEVIPALGHEYSDWVIVINPSCNSEGKDEKACIKCGNIIERDTRITGIENKVLVSNPVDKEYFVGKTLLTIGDSITCGVGLNDKTNEYYGKLVADALGMNVVNKGISGSVYCYGGSATTNNTLNASNIKNADVITIFLGINDFNHSCKNGHAYGNPNYTSSDKTYYQVGEYGTTDTSTLYGALKVWCENIEQLKSIEGYEDKQFVIITPLITSWNASIGTRSWDQGKTNIHGHTLREYCTAIMRVYAEYGIPVFDANMLSGIYYNSASDNNAVATGGDGVHINAEGHKILANSLIEFLLEGYSYEYRENNSNAHQYNKTIVDPTCTLDGYTKHICSICYDVYNTDFVNALGHEIIIDEKVEPTCENTGLTNGEHCTKCDYKVAQEVIPALGHDIVIDEKVEPEYNNPGLTEGKHCSRCYLVIEEQVIIEPNIKQMNINYDDHIDISNNVVAIIEKGNPISYKVGYGVSGELDDQVISIKNNYLVATGIGDAVVKIDDIYYEINVKSAPISLILLIGQSNMRGSEGDPNQSIICPNGMVYSTYGDDRGDKEGILNVNSARKFVPSALSGEYSMINVEGTTEHLGYYPVNSLTREGKGKFGPDSGFAYEWVKQTNEKIWVVNAAHGGSSINTWQPNATNYKEAVLMFKACQETLQKEIEAGHFTLSHMGYFWCQGCNDAAQTAEWYVNKYVAMHNNLKVDLAFDHDNSENTDDVVFEFGGIIPILYGVNSYRLGVSKYKNNYTYYQSYEQLYFNGPRVAQYWLGNSQEYSDIWVVCDVQEDWVYYPDGTHGVVEYFNAHYPGGIVDYETQVTQKSSWYQPTKPNHVHDSIHYNQIGYNEIGRESVRNALIMLGEIEAPDVETKVEFYSWDGITTVDEIVSLTNVCSETLIVPRIYPLWKAKDVEFILSEGLEYNYYDLTTESFDINGTLCVNIDPDTKVNVKAKELVNYEFEFVDGAYVSSNEEYNSISKIAGTFKDNVFIDARFKLAKPITLMYNQEWMLEFKLSGNWYEETSTTSKKLLCQDGASATVNSMALLITGITNRIHIGYYNGSTHVSFGVSLIDYGIDVKEEHVYQLINVINNETNMIYLVVDGQTIAPMTTCITGKDGITGEVSNYLSGKNLSFSYMGTSKYEIDNGLIHYLKVYEKDANVDVHMHEWSDWTTVSNPSMESAGLKTRTCLTCHLEEKEDVKSIWQTTDILDHYTELPEEVCCGVNLWSILPHDPTYYLISSGTWGYHSSKNVPSVTIPIEPGDKIFATSFGKAGENGHATASGIRLTFFDINGVVKTLSVSETYSEFVANGGYIVAPEGSIAANIALWNNNDDNEIYILNRDHVYTDTKCTICDALKPEGIEFQGKVISILGDSISTFDGYIPVEDGFNLEHLPRYPQSNLLTDVNETWWLQVINTLGAKLGINDSWRGATVSGAHAVTTGTSGENASMANLTRIQNLGSNGTPDVILFYGGTNDLAHVTKIGTFNKDNINSDVDLTTTKWDNLVDGYVNTLKRLKYYYPNAQIICLLPTVTTSYYSNTKLNTANEVLISICDHFDIPYVDLRYCGITTSNLPDGIHPDAIGMDFISDAVIEVMLSECKLNIGEHIVHKIENNLSDVTSLKSYIKGVDDKSFYQTTLSGDIISVSVVMGGVDITKDCLNDNIITINEVTDDIVITAVGVKKPIYEDYLNTNLEHYCPNTNLWTLLEHNEKYFDGSNWIVHSSGNVDSITILINPGDKIFATSFKKAGENGHSSMSGIRLTFFNENGGFNSYGPGQTYSEFVANGGYIIAPESAVAVCICMWNRSDENEIYILNSKHLIEDGKCTICNEIIS